MKSYNIKQDLPSKALALDRLNVILKYEREPIIKIIHGYGSHGVGGDIKLLIRQILQEKMDRSEIKAFIPGEAFGHLLGYDYLIRAYQKLLEKDTDYKKPNEGITYIIL